MREDDFGGLHADSWQRADGFESMRNFSAVFVHEFFCCLKKVLCLHAIIVHASEHEFDFLGFELQEVRWSFHEFEESLCGLIHSFICHLSGEHHGHEELKWRLEIQLNQFRGIECKYALEYFITLEFRSEFHRDSVISLYFFTISSLKNFAKAY